LRMHHLHVRLIWICLHVLQLSSLLLESGSHREALAEHHRISPFWTDADNLTCRPDEANWHSGDNLTSRPHLVYRTSVNLLMNRWPHWILPQAIL
jgi:hypothetical protein